MAFQRKQRKDDDLDIDAEFEKIITKKGPIKPTQMMKFNEIEKKPDLKPIKPLNNLEEGINKNSKPEEKEKNPGGMFRPSSPFKITKGKMNLASVEQSQPQQPQQQQQQQQQLIPANTLFNEGKQEGDDFLSTKKQAKKAEEAKKDLNEDLRASNAFSKPNMAGRKISKDYYANQATEEQNKKEIANKAQKIEEKKTGSTVNDEENGISKDPQSNFAKPFGQSQLNARIIVREKKEKDILAEAKPILKPEPEIFKKNEPIVNKKPKNMDFDDLDDEYTDDFEKSDDEKEKEKEQKIIASKPNLSLKTKMPLQKTPNQSTDMIDIKQEMKRSIVQVSPIRPREEINYIQQRNDNIDTNTAFETRGINFSEANENNGADQLYSKMPIDKDLIEDQKERAKNLREFLSLEYENFDLFEIQSATEYEYFINNIRSGLIKNSCDQSNDERVEREIQTEEDYIQDFSNQCPEDKQKTYIDNKTQFNNNIIQQNQANQDIDTTRFIEFIMNTGSIFEEILTYQEINKKTNQNLKTKAQVNQCLNYQFPSELCEILKFKLVTSSYIIDNTKCIHAYNVSMPKGKSDVNFSIIILYTQNISIKYMLSLSAITSLYVPYRHNHMILAGTKDGSLLVWDLRESDIIHSKNQHDIIKLIYNKLEDKASKYILRLPNYSTDYLATQGHSSAIIKIKGSPIYSSSNEITTLEEFGKIIIWNILELSISEAHSNITDVGMSINSRIKVTKIMSINLQDSIPREMTGPAFVCFNFDAEYKTASNIFVCTTLGIVKTDKTGMTKAPKIYGDSLCEFPCSVHIAQEEFLFVGYTSGTIRIFSKHFSEPLIEISGFTNIPIIMVNVLSTRFSKQEKIELLQHLISVDSRGNIFIFDLLKNIIKPIQEINLIKDEEIKEIQILTAWLDESNIMRLIYVKDTDGINTAVQRDYDCNKQYKNEQVKSSNDKILSLLKTYAAV